jgi:hypothetical protein
LNKPPHASAEVGHPWATWVVSENWGINPGFWPTIIDHWENDVEIEKFFPPSCQVPNPNLKIIATKPKYHIKLIA